MTKPKRKPKHYRPQRPYRGQLAKSIEVSEIKTYRNGESFYELDKRELETAIKIQADRMTFVFEHFGIEREDKNKWRSVAMAIAENCIPGVGVVLVRRAGQPRKIKGNERQFLDRIGELESEGASHDDARKKAAREFGSTAGPRALRNMESAARTKVNFFNLRLERYFSDDPEFLRSLRL